MLHTELQNIKYMIAFEPKHLRGLMEKIFFAALQVYF